jgi:hypothetical protein
MASDPDGRACHGLASAGKRPEALIRWLGVGKGEVRMPVESRGHVRA